MTTDPAELNPTDTPSAHNNPPALQTIAYRQGTHATVLQRLRSRLGQQEIPDDTKAITKRPLQTLSTHDREDAAMALLDSWAMVADVLSFYQERIANEGFLRTATEDRSILELSRTIGYELRPGVAATVPLVFTVEDAPGSEPQVTVPQATQVQSIPTQPGELPQTFETVEALQARVEWNCLTPRLEQRSIEPTLEPGDTTLRLQGTNTLLQTGDTILILGNERETSARSDRWCWLTLTEVKPDLQAGYTEVTFSEALPAPLPTNPQVFALRQKASLFGYNAAPLNYQRNSGRPIVTSGVGTITSSDNSITTNNTTFENNLKGGVLIVGNESRRILSVENASRLTIDTSFNSNFINQPFSYIKPEVEWQNFKMQGSQIDLDTLYPKVLPQSWVVLSQKYPSEQKKLYRVIKASTVFREDFGLSNKITRLEADASLEAEQFDLRQTSVFLQSEKLELFKETTLNPPISKNDQSTTIALDRLIPHLKSGQPIIISGSCKNAEDPDAIVYEFAFVESMEDIKGDVEKYTVLTIAGTLQHDDYDPLTLKIYANVVQANHGATVTDEVLGSGDGTKANQQFTLNKPPLTYISTPNSEGIQSTLRVYVNQVLWRQVRSLHNQDARSQCYIVQTDEQGQTRIIFGDGVQGARLPSGQENVRATYRSGIGQVGEVKAGSLILLQNRPLGIRSVTNPFAASGAADRDSFETVRQNAPRTVLTLDRVVSLRDFENFAQSFAGIGKAQATPIWTNGTRQIYITVADRDGQAAPPALCQTLKDAIAAAGNAQQSVTVASYQPDEGLFNLSAKVLIDDRYRFENVKPQILQALRQAFSFQAREFGQGVAASEVMQIIQNVEGVIAVDLNSLYLKNTKVNSNERLESFLAAQLAHWDFEKGKAKSAQILLLNSDESSIVLQEWR